MSTPVISNQPVSIPTGTFTIPATPIAASSQSATLSLARCTTATPTVWPNATTTLDMSLEVSYDNGTTWVGGGGITGASGGIEHRHDGSENPTAAFTFSYPAPPTNIRGTLTVGGGPLVSTLSVTFN